MPSPLPCSPVIREWLRKKNPDRKKTKNKQTKKKLTRQSFEFLRKKSVLWIFQDVPACLGIINLVRTQSFPKN